MPNFLRKRLQVFISSTFTDLRAERQAAVEAILTAGHIPAGMELFTAGDESQMQVIKQWIDESDIYLLILGGRYGSLDPKRGKSYTQIEYEYALSKNMPLFACVINEAALDTRVRQHGRSVLESENPKPLSEFRSLVLSKMSKFWDDTKDIKIAVTETLSHIARRDDLAGWVRPSAQSNIPALTDELARLSKENAALRSQLTSAQPGQSFSGLSFPDFKVLLEKQGLLNLLLFVGRGTAGKVETSDFLYKKLEAYGLIDLLDRNAYLIASLTPHGRAFFIRYEADEFLKQKANTS